MPAGKTEERGVKFLLARDGELERHKARVVRQRGVHAKNSGGGGGIPEDLSEHDQVENAVAHEVIERLAPGVMFVVPRGKDDQTASPSENMQT